MSSHAETGHGHESAHHGESAVETLFEGITKIFSSVRIAVTKVYTGIKGLLSDLADSLKGSPGHHAAAHTDHANHAPHAETPHPAEGKKEEHH